MAEQIDLRGLRPQPTPAPKLALNLTTAPSPVAAAPAAPLPLLRQAPIVAPVVQPPTPAPAPILRKLPVQAAPMVATPTQAMPPIGGQMAIPPTNGQNAAIPVSPQGIAPLGQQSILGSADHQARLGQAFDQLLQGVVAGPDKRSQREMAAAQIFNGAAGVLGGIMGGGYAQGGMQLLQNAQSQVQDMKGQRHQQQLEAAQGLKTLSDIISNTDPNSAINMAKALKNANDAKNAQTKADNADTYANRAATDAWYKAGSLDARNRSIDMRNGLGMLNAQLKAAGLIQQGTLADKRAEQVQHLEEMKQQTAMKIAQLRADTANNIVDKNNQSKLNELHQQYRNIVLNQIQKAREVQAHLALEATKTNELGEPVYKNFTVPDLVGQLKASLSDDDFGDLLGGQPTAISAPAPTQPVQPAPSTPPTAAPGSKVPTVKKKGSGKQSQTLVPPPPPAPSLTGLIQTYGGGITGAKAYWKSLPAEAQAQNAKLFHAAFGKYPWE